MTIAIQHTDLTSICPDPVIAVDDAGYISLFNPAAERLLGYMAEQVVGVMHISSVYPSEEEAKKIMRLILSGQQGDYGKVEGYETFIITNSAERVPIRLSAALIGEKGAYKGSIGFFHDLTQQKSLEATLKKQSITDDMSGLYNQRYFYSQVAREMERAKRYGSELSLVCIDLDGFKLVNDRLGHLEGDQIIRSIGDLMGRGLRESDMAFRYGGDEFMLLLPNTNVEHAMQLANRMRYMFNTSCTYSPEFSDDSGVVVSMSLGVATSRGAEPVDYFIQRADMAMYRAKNIGGNCT
ncbi:MAG: sensor domain-containing diguanylate cyclase [Amphritea sp.]